jgi:hypothetical protein
MTRVLIVSAACFGTLEGERETYLHRIAFQTLSEAALDPAASRALILQVAESYWSGTWRRASA